MTQIDRGAMLKNTSLVLGMINVLQPVSWDVLLGQFGPDRAEDLVTSLKILNTKKLIRKLPAQSYRTTWAGQNSLWSDVLTKGRDIQRMWYLSDLSDNCRRDKKGEAS